MDSQKKPELKLPTAAQVTMLHAEVDRAITRAVELIGKSQVSTKLATFKEVGVIVLSGPNASALLDHVMQGIEEFLTLTQGPASRRQTTVVAADGSRREVLE